MLMVRLAENVYDWSPSGKDQNAQTERSENGEIESVRVCDIMIDPQVRKRQLP